MLTYGNTGSIMQFLLSLLFCFALFCSFGGGLGGEGGGDFPLIKQIFNPEITNLGTYLAKKL